MLTLDTRQHLSKLARRLGAIGLGACVLLAVGSGCVPSASEARAPDGGAASARIARGKEIFDKQAGNLSAGCAFCHGEDGRGRLAPDIRGRTAAEINKALETVPQMQPMKLSRDDVMAVAAYLRLLQTQR